MTAGASDRQDLGGLYPFLYDGHGDVDRVLEEVRRSTREKAAQTLELRTRVLDEHASALMACAAVMASRFAAGGRLFTFGNGGSSTDAQSIAQTFLHPERGRPLPAYALTGDVATITALANDVGFEVVFARQLAATGRREDIALGLSTSGGSSNILRAFEEASRRGMLTIGLAGYDGGSMATAGTIDNLFVVPSDSVHRIQESQTTLFHVLWELTQTTLGERQPA